MNLTKYFNLKFLKEHIKSQAQLIFSATCLLPILLVFNLVLLILNQSYGIVSFTKISIITLLGNFIIPVILAFSLFGFIHKKKRVDFYLSKPINRTTIYFSNILGGLSIIVILMLFNSFILLLFNYFSPLAIPFKLIIDYFLYYVVSYSLMFAITSLAISLSGNFLASLVVIFLLTLMYPFTSLVDTAFRDSSNHHVYYVTDTCKVEEDCYNSLSVSEKNYTFTTLINSVIDDDYQTSSVLKSFFLTVSYFAIGYFVFLKRKMENNECSFKNQKLYYVIKLLTFLPVCFLSYLLLNSKNASNMLIAFAIPFAYYILYDLIMQKGYKNIRRTFISLGIAFPLFLGLYYSLDHIIYPKEIRVNKVDKITFEKYYYQGIEYYTNLEITDPIVIEKILDDSTYGYYNYTYAYKFNLKYHGIYYTDTFYLTNSREDIIDDYITSHHILSDKEKFDFKKTSYAEISSNKILKIPITDKFLEECQNTNSAENIYGIEVSLYYYANHKYYERQIPINANLNIFKDMTSLLNQDFLKEASYERTNIIPYTNKYIALEDKFANFLINNYVISKSKDKLKEFLEQHQNDKIADVNNSLILEEYNSRNQQENIYIIQDIEAFLIEWDKWNEDLKDNLEYKQYQQESINWNK